MTQRVTDEQLGKVTKRVLDLFRRVKEGTLDPEEVCKGLQLIIEGEFTVTEEKILKGKIFRITILYNQRVEDEIASAGLAYADSNITNENFSTDEETAKGTVETDAIIVHFNEPMTSEEVIAALDKKGLRPGTPKELVALHKGCDNQDALQDELPLVALGGKVWQDSRGLRFVAYLSRFGSKRNLNPHWFDDGWNSDYRFLAFRK